jgi:hypothetical protein
MLTFQTASHLPLQVSNYALLGENKLSAAELNTLSNLLQQQQVVLIFGYQENI